jgi:hypothetical protein
MRPVVQMPDFAGDRAEPRATLLRRICRITSVISGNQLKKSGNPSARLEVRIYGDLMAHSCCAFAKEGGAPLIAFSPIGRKPP